MGQNPSIRLTQTIRIQQFNLLRHATSNLDACNSEIVRTAFDNYLDPVDSLSHNSKTPVA
jgi:hypothetical protein